MPTNRQYRLATRPVGLPADSTWDWVESAPGEPADGEVQVRVQYLSLDPAMRGWMSEAKSYLPPIAIGEVMRALGVGTVVSSKAEGFEPGDWVYGVFGIQDYWTGSAKQARKIDVSLAPPPVWLSALGMVGMTAYFGLLDVCDPKPGETVVVSAAAGAVGSLVGQIARIKGCRVIGIAGGPEKCAYVTGELGFDACIDYKSQDVRKHLAAHCPKGIDVYFDNVGGEILDAVLANLAMNARISICGAISQYNSTTGVTGPRNYLALLIMRSRMQGFLVMDYAPRFGEGIADIAKWRAEGRLKSREDIQEGLRNFPSVFRMLFSGENNGKLILKVD